MTPVPINDRDTARARCASDRNPDWPLWFVERNGPNVAWCDFFPKFASRAECEAEAKRLNGTQTEAAKPSRLLMSTITAFAEAVTPVTTFWDKPITAAQLRNDTFKDPCKAYLMGFPTRHRP